MRVGIQWVGKLTCPAHPNKKRDVALPTIIPGGHAVMAFYGNSRLANRRIQDKINVMQDAGLAKVPDGGD
jgi:hypothetical protein